MSKKNRLVPKRIINEKGIETTVYVRPEQSQSMKGNPIRDMGAPQSSSAVSIEGADTARYDRTPKGIRGRVTKPSDPALLTQDLPSFAGEEAERTVLGWAESFHNRRYGVGPNTRDEHMIREGAKALSEARERDGEGSEDAVMWGAYLDNMTKRLSDGRSDMTILNARKGLSARLRGPHVTGRPRHLEETVVTIDGKNYDLAEVEWSTDRTFSDVFNSGNAI